jgi:hypothetical protein
MKADPAHEEDNPMQRRGFTLIELPVVIAPGYAGYSNISLNAE